MPPRTSDYYDMAYVEPPPDPLWEVIRDAVVATLADLSGKTRIGFGAISRWGVHRHAMAVQEAATALQRHRNILLSSIYQPPDEPRTRPPTSAEEKDRYLQWSMGFEEQVWSVLQQTLAHVHAQERHHVEERRREEETLGNMYTKPRMDHHYDTTTTSSPCTTETQVSGPTCTPATHRGCCVAG